MTRALASEFQKATKAAHKAAEESKKAAKVTAQEYKKTSEKVKKSFREQQLAAQKAAKKISSSFGGATDSQKKVAEAAEVQATSFGAASLAIDRLLPNLSEGAKKTLSFADGLATAAEQAIKGGLATAGVTIAVIALTATYSLFTREQQKATKRFEAFKESLKRTGNIISDYRREIDALSSSISVNIGDFNQLAADLAGSRLELRKLRGDINEQEFERLHLLAQQKKEIEDISGQFNVQRQQISERAKKARESVKILNKEIKGLEEVRKGLIFNSKEERETTQLLLERMRKRRELNEIVERENFLLDDSLRHQGQIVKAINNKQEAERKVLSEQQKQEKIQEARAKAEKHRADFMSSIADLNTKINQLEQESLTLSDSLLSKEEQIKKTARDKRDALDGQLQSMIAQVEQLELNAKTEEQVLFAEEARLDLERASEAVKKSKASITEKEKRDLEELNKKTEDLIKKQEKLSQIASLRVQLEDAALNAFLESLPASKQLEAQEIKLALAKQETIDKINEARDASLASAETQEERDMIEADRKKAMFAAEAGYILELESLREKAHQKQLQQSFEGTKVFVSGISEATTASLELMQKSGNKNKRLITALFMANKTAALAEIVMNTAKSISAAGAQFGAFAPLAIAGYVATAAAQSAIVMSQQPPKFHMGGMIEKTPDERVVVVKQGEAILDRATVNALGDSGVSRLQNGQSMSPEVIVMNPYKHFDRFMQDRARSGLSARSARRGY